MTTETSAKAEQSGTSATQTDQPSWLIRLSPAFFLLLWSFGFPIAKIGTAYADPLLFLTLRYALVLAVLMPLVMWLNPSWPSRLIEWLHIAVVGVLIQTVYFGFCYTAFALGISAGTVALVVSLQPVLVALFAPLLVDEVIGLKGWAGFALGSIGAVIVILGRSSVETTSVAGLICSVGALIGMSGAVLYERRFGRGQHPVAANVIQYAAGLVTTLPLALAFGTLRVTWSSEMLGALAYLVIGNSLIAITLLLAMIRRGEASRVSALFYLVPPTAALISWLLLGEEMPPLAWAGMAIASIGVAMVSALQRAK